MAATISEVAKLARVSISSVSRVLNHTGPFSPSMEKAVMEAVRALNYQPSAVARSLARKRTMSLGCIVPDIRNPFYAQICWRAEQVAKANGYTIIICNTDNNPQEEVKYLRVMKDRRVDGILMAGSLNDATNIINFKAREETPVVLMDFAVEGYDIPCVVLDNLTGAKLMTDYLVSLGHESIVFATSDATSAERMRLEGFRRAMLEHGRHVEPEMVVSIPEKDWRAKEFGPLAELLARPSGRPGAVFCSNDLKAIFVYELVRRLKLSIPRDISVVGYDDIEMASYLGPPLTTVSQPIDAMTAQGMVMLLAEANGDHLAQRRVEMVPQLVIRRSTRPAPGRAQGGRAD